MTDGNGSQQPDPSSQKQPGEPDQPHEELPVEAEIAEEHWEEEPTTMEPGALDRTEGHMLSKHVKTVFGCWVVVFALVGAQMGWVLRPFIGSPDVPFEWFRERESNFFESVWRSSLTFLT